MRRILVRLLLAALLIFPSVVATAAGSIDSTAVVPGQTVTTEIASSVKSAFYTLDIEQVKDVVTFAVKANKGIMALTIVDAFSNEKALIVSRNGDKVVFGQALSNEILNLDHYFAPIIFEEQMIGTVEVYYAHAPDEPTDFAAVAKLFTADEQVWITNHPVISVGIEEWYPFVRTEKDGTPGGIAGDFISLVMKKTGLRTQVISDDWNTLLTNFEQGKIDLLPATYYTDERATYGLYSNSFFSAKEFLYVKRENENIRTFDDLSSKKLAIVKGFGTIPKIRENFPSVEIVETDSQLASIYAVLNGEVDALFESQVVIDDLIRRELISGLKAIAQTSFDASSLHFFSHIDKPVLHSILIKALDSISKTEKREIISKWVSTQIEADNIFQVADGVPFNQANFILQYLAATFAIILAVAFAIWVVRGRPKQLSIRETLLVVFFVFSGLIVSIGTFVTLLLEGERVQAEIESRNYESLNLAFELKQSSDDLTRFGRTFVVTGEQVYENYYRAIIDIRDGKRAHPRLNLRSYWDFVIAGVVDPDEDGETYSLEQRMLDLGFSVEEQQKLAEAKKESDDLVTLEVTAMNAVHGVYRDARGYFTVKAKPNLAMARRLLHGASYHAAKAKIMKPIEEFFTLLDSRITNDLVNIRSRNEAIILGITILTAITIIFAIYSFLLLKRRLVLPLSKLESGTNIVKAGDYSHHINITSLDEVGALASAFNSMTNSIEQRNSELQDAFNVISSSIEYASRIQRSTLPSDEILSAVVQDHFILWEPRDVVGGDMYWHGAWGDGCLILLGDCTGHGVPGAFMTLITVGALERAMSEVEGGNLGALITRVHQYIQVTLGQHYGAGDSDDGIELGACYFVPDEPQMTFVGARFELFIADSNEITVVKGTKRGMGYRNISYTQVYDENTVSMKPDYRYFLATDGLVDQIGGERRRMFGKKRFKELLLNIQDKSMPRQKELIADALLEYQGDEKRRDDVSVIGFKIA